MNIHLQPIPSPNSADFRLLISSVDHKGQNTSTIGSININDPELGQKLSLIFQAYRMGTIFGLRGED